MDLNLFIAFINFPSVLFFLLFTYWLEIIHTQLATQLSIEEVLSPTTLFKSGNFQFENIEIKKVNSALFKMLYNC